MHERKLHGRVALILGAGTSAPGVSIGKACSIAMARAGAQVAALDLKIEAAKETVNDIRAEGGEAIAYAADVANTDQMQSAIDAVMKDWGRIDILQINAGIGKVEYVKGPEGAKMQISIIHNIAITRPINDVSKRTAQDQ